MATATTTADLIQQLYLVEGKAEIVNGEIVEMSPASDWHGRAVMNIATHLHSYARQALKGRGQAYADNVAFLADLPNRKSFSPDAAYYTGPAGKKKFLPEAPIFAVEVRSSGDYGPAAERELAQKRADYFLAGTQVVWDVDLDEECIRVYRSTHPLDPQRFELGETVDAEPAVPGWSLLVDEVFEW